MSIDLSTVKVCIVGNNAFIEKVKKQLQNQGNIHISSRVAIHHLPQDLPDNSIVILLFPEVQNLLGYYVDDERGVYKNKNTLFIYMTHEMDESYTVPAVSKRLQERVHSQDESPPFLVKSCKDETWDKELAYTIESHLRRMQA